MDRITQSLLRTFAAEYDLKKMSEAEQFERFAAFSMIRRNYSRSFDVEDVIVGGSDDTAIDAIAIIANNTLITEIETVDELAEQLGYLDVSFVFVQAERSSNFDGSKIGDFAYGVRDFFDPSPKIRRNDKVKRMADILDAVFSHSAILRARSCFMYYVTTGKWTDDKNLCARRDSAISDINALSIFNNIRFPCVGAEELHNAYTQTKNAVTRTFEFKARNDLPTTEGIKQAFIGYVPFSQFKKIIEDESGTSVLSSIFYDNVRDWQEYNSVNDKIRQTLDSPEKSRFVFMNNGVTIIARSISPVASIFTISDYQIVNGCQTSNVLFDQRDIIDDSVCVPLRLIETRDEGVMDAIIEATNSQTEVKPEQYFARLKFARRLERYFDSIDEDNRIFYERRDGQYDRGSETKTRVISQTSVIRAFGATYLEEPHRTTRGYMELRARVGGDVFGEDHRLEPYYAASYAYYLLESRFRAKSTPVEYKPARYLVLLAARLLVDAEKPTFMNSGEMGRRGSKFSAALWDRGGVDDLFQEAVNVVDEATGNRLERDHVRTAGVTSNILAHFGRQSA